MEDLWMLIFASIIIGVIITVINYKKSAGTTEKELRELKKEIERLKKTKT